MSKGKPIARLTAGESSSGSVIGVFVTGLPILVVFVALGVVAKVVYDSLPPGMAFPGLLVALAVLGFGGLYVVVRVRDWLR